MKISLSILLLFSIIEFSIGQENTNVRVINSLTEWIEEINNWPDSIYRQADLEVRFNLDMDQHLIESRSPAIDHMTDTLEARTVINKDIEIYGLSFPSFGIYNPTALKNLHFKKRFQVYDLQNHRFYFKNTRFDQLCQIRLIHTLFDLSFIGCTFNGYFNFNNPRNNLLVIFRECQFNYHSYLSSTHGVFNLILKDCQFKGGFSLGDQTKFNSVLIYDSSFEVMDLKGIVENTFEMVNSSASALQLVGFTLPQTNTYINYEQLQNRLSILTSLDREDGPVIHNAETDSVFKNKEFYDRLNAQYALLQGIYSARGEMESYNACYVEMKDFETRRLKYIYQENPSFDSFFTFKINQFLKVFSAYGTRPSKAIIFSMKVIIFFSMIYLLFPNSWDKHGKTRIINRYTFFLKYMNKNAGFHEVYLEDQKEDLMEFAEFKEIVQSAGKTVPRFFSTTAIPLYKWAVAGTKFSASLLRRVDIMKGTWQELPQSKRFWKSILLVSAFIVAILYDILIKILNALMLSINTFTTLGFGEIPLRGFPRYLAIIQGFIGWFMLTIFSVSLISQLLN